MENKVKKETKLKTKIKEMKKTNRGKALLRLLKWGIFFFAIFIFLIISSFFRPSNVSYLPNNEPINPVDTSDNLPTIPENIPDEMFDLNHDLLINDLKTLDKYEYNYEITINEAKYLFNGYKNKLVDEGYKTSNMGTIKYYIDETGIYEKTIDSLNIIENLYENINSQYLDFNYLANYFSNLSFLTNCTDCNEMRDDINTIKVSYQNQKLFSIDIISNDYEYYLEFKNIEASNE